MVPAPDQKPLNSLLVCPDEDSYGYLEPQLQGDRALFDLERGVREAQIRKGSGKIIWSSLWVITQY